MADLLRFPGRVTADDTVERERALDVRASWIVEAPAGSGKTGLLIQRFLKLLADESVTAPEEVLAITFTVKATGEMRERVLGQLEGAAAGTMPMGAFDRMTRPMAEAVLRRDRALGWGLLEEPRRLNIRTIDSVCAEIARALPVLSGSGGRLAPTLDPAGLYQEAARRTLGQLGGADARLSEALASLLQHRDGNLMGCERLIATMLASREQWGGMIPLSAEELEDAALDATMLPRLERALEVVICRALTQLSRTVPEAALRELTAAAAEFGYLDGYNGKASPIAICAGRNEPPGERAEHLAHWRALIHLVVAPSQGSWRRSFNKNHVMFETKDVHKGRLKAIVARLQDDPALLEVMCGLDKLPPARYPAEQWAVVKTLFRVLRRALAELQVVFAERGACDFAELGLAARTALGHDSGAGDLAAALGVRTRHLLVDEMQDTSTSQYELIGRMTQGWDGQSQTVFLVGDPKQSIYLFRQARVERFVRTLHEERLGEMHVGALRLTANFRSQAGLVGDFNGVFRRIFPARVDGAHPEEVPYVEAAAKRGVGGADGLTWHVRAVAYDADATVKTRNWLGQRRLDARSIREIAIAWRDKPLPTGRTEAWRIAVLVRSRPHLKEVVAELRRKGVPFRAVEIEPLGERQEVLDLTALTRALLHPADRVAWFAILHAPWCGLSLGDLHRLAGEDDAGLRERCVGELIEDRGHLLSVDGEQRLARVWPVLVAAAAEEGRMRLAERVERTWRSLGGDAYLEAGERENAMRFFGLLDEMETAGGRLDLAALEKRMERLYATPALHPGAVDVMTIHQAKGLEWDVVLVPGLDRKPPPDRGELLDWVELDTGEEATAQVVLTPIQGSGEDSTELRCWIRSVHATRHAAERKRLLYVACTRAREELHLFAVPETSAKGEVRAADCSLLETAWVVAAEHVQMTLAPQMKEEEQTFDLAASGDGLELVEAIGRPPLLYRLPLEFDAAGRFADLAARGTTGAEAAGSFLRPEGSLAARAFGNAVHAFLEIAAERIGAGESAEGLGVEVSGWLPRAAAVLRSAGLAPAVVTRGAQRVVAALAATLASREGQWILAAHPDAASEYAMGGRQGAAGVRLDRVFRAGARPYEAGTEFLWIVDYKTGTHGAGGLETFLEEQRELYRAQLEAYARSVRELTAERPDRPAGLRVALFYPALAQLTWWDPAL